MTKTQKAIRIIEAAMLAGASDIGAASEAERRTGLPIISAGPELWYRWGFFVIARNGKRVLRYHRVHTRYPVETRL
jgi:hypothetical protein